MALTEVSRRAIDEYAQIRKDDPIEQAIRDRVVELANVFYDEHGEVSEVEMGTATVALALHDAADYIEFLAEKDPTVEQMKAYAELLRKHGKALCGITPPPGSPMR